MKKLVLFTYRPEIGMIYYEDLYILFGKYFEIYHYALNQGESPTREQLGHADIILVSNEEIINQIHHLIDKKSRIIMIDFGYPAESIERMKEFPVGTYALACFDPFVCRKMVNLFYEQGINNFIWLYPQAGGDIPLSGYDVAVVDDYSPYPLPGGTETINLGKRKFAFSTLLKIAQETGILDETLESEFITYCYHYKSATTLVNTIYNNMSSFHSQVKMILNYMDSGIAILDKEQRIIEYNSYFTTMFQIHHELYGIAIQDVPETKELIPYIKKGEAIRNELIVSPDFRSSLVLNMECIKNGINPSYNYILILQEMEEIEDKSHFLKRQMKLKGYMSKYRFSDLRTNSPEMISCIKKAKRIAAVDKTTLIVGESGTGKELMAQSIHSASRRKNYPFVSINCAALPSSLLESELFGYVEGAFTGSKKGGKPGLFEMANYGTLFLDEIGEASLEVQSKLLRAIETKEIMRLGGDKIISVDVRILAATNQNLDDLVEKKEFRLDLYYRLNSMIIKLPPLRARTNDILYLAQEFIREETHRQREIKPELCEFLEQYPWKGNIRELRNVVEYMVNITDGPLTTEDLPEYILENHETQIHADKEERDHSAPSNSQRYRGETPRMECFFLPESSSCSDVDADTIYHELAERYPVKEIRMIFFLLRQIKAGTRSRAALTQKAVASGEYISDYKMRKLLEELKSFGLISYSRGPAGISLNQLGSTLADTVW